MKGLFHIRRYRSLARYCHLSIALTWLRFRLFNNWITNQNSLGFLETTCRDGGLQRFQLFRNIKQRVFLRTLRFISILCSRYKKQSFASMIYIKLTLFSSSLLYPYVLCVFVCESDIVANSLVGVCEGWTCVCNSTDGPLQTLDNRKIINF